MKHSTLMKPLLILPFNLRQHLEHMRATHGTWMRVLFSNEKDARENHWITNRLWLPFCVHLNPLVMVGNEWSILFQPWLCVFLDSAFHLVHTIGLTSTQVTCGWIRPFYFSFKENHDILLEWNAVIELVIAIGGTCIASPQLRKKTVWVGDGYSNAFSNHYSFKWE